MTADEAIALAKGFVEVGGSSYPLLGARFWRADKVLMDGSPNDHVWCVSFAIHQPPDSIICPGLFTVIVNDQTGHVFMAPDA